MPPAAARFCAACGAPRPSERAYTCPRCNAWYADTAEPAPPPDGFVDWVRRGAGLAVGFLLVGLVASLISLVVLIQLLGGVLRPT